MRLAGATTRTVVCSQMNSKGMFCLASTLFLFFNYLVSTVHVPQSCRNQCLAFFGGGISSADESLIMEKENPHFSGTVPISSQP
jgi:hypothetical protein